MEERSMKRTSFFAQKMRKERDCQVIVVQATLAHRGMQLPTVGVGVALAGCVIGKATCNMSACVSKIEHKRHKYTVATQSKYVQAYKLRDEK